MVTQQRESNMELLRIVAILMITLHHFLIDKYRGGIVYGDEFLEGWQWAVMLNGFVYIGVNVFVLISGYFGIKFKWKGVMNLFIFCAFYMALNLLQQDFIGYEQYTSTEILFKSLKALKNTSKWFIPCYLALYFISPFLNTARDSLSKHQYICALIVLSVYCLWFGYIRQSNVFNHNGYTVGQFIWLYFIGGYIRRFNAIQSVRKYRMVCVSIWLILSLLWGGGNHSSLFRISTSSVASNNLQQSFYSHCIYCILLFVYYFPFPKQGNQLYRSKCFGGIFVTSQYSSFFKMVCSHQYAERPMLFPICYNLDICSVYSNDRSRSSTSCINDSCQLVME